MLTKLFSLVMVPLPIYGQLGIKRQTLTSLKITFLIMANSLMENTFSPLTET